MHFVLGTLFGLLMSIGGIWGLLFWLGRDDLQADRMASLRSPTIL